MEQVMVDRLMKFVDNNPDITFLYEYSEVRRRFLISYSVSDNIDDNDPIWDKLGELIVSLDTSFPNRTPFFTQDDIIFSLSPSAVTVKSKLQTELDEQTFSLVQNEEYCFEEFDNDQVFYGSYRVYSKAA